MVDLAVARAAGGHVIATDRIAAVEQGHVAIRRAGLVDDGPDAAVTGGEAFGLLDGLGESRMLLIEHDKIEKVAVLYPSGEAFNYLQMSRWRVLRRVGCPSGVTIRAT